MLIKIGMPTNNLSGPTLLRNHNFQDLRELLHSGPEALVHETEVVGADYVRVALRPKLGNGNIDFIEFAPDFLAVIGDLAFQEDVAFQYSGEDWIRFGFKVQGGHSMVVDGGRAESLDGRVSHCFTHPADVYQSDHYAARHRLQWVSILCKRNHLVESLGFDLNDLPPELARFLDAGIADPFVEKRPLSFVMNRLLQEMIAPPSYTAFKPIYLKAKAYEALYTYLEQMRCPEAQTFEAAGLKLKRADLDRLEHARSLIEEERPITPDVPGLARQVGLNRNKLSVGFHAVYGQTVFDFCKDVRLSYAHQLVECSDLNMSQIADRLGYGHASTFSNAFRKHFGYSPSRLISHPSAGARPRRK